MRIIYKLLLTLSATLWMWVVYYIRQFGEWAYSNGGLISVMQNKTMEHQDSFWGMIITLSLSVVLPFVLLALLKKCSNYGEIRECNEVQLADNEFLPTYLGYFFVSLGINEIFTMSVVFLIVSIFTFISTSHYFNPMFLLKGYHFYHVRTAMGTDLLLIQKGKIIRRSDGNNIGRVRELNDITYISIR